MHDFILAKEIIDELGIIAKERGLFDVEKVNVEIGMISLAHDGYSEHTEDISVDNLQFGLKNIARGTKFENVKFVINKVAGDNWKITDIEVK